MKSLIAITFILLSIDLNAKTDHEFIDEIGREVHSFRFKSSKSFGTFHADLIVNKDGVSMKSRSGLIEFDREVLRAANRVWDNSVTLGLVIPVTYSASDLDTSIRNGSYESIIYRERNPLQ